MGTWRDSRKKTLDNYLKKHDPRSSHRNSYFTDIVIKSRIAYCVKNKNLSKQCSATSENILHP